MRWVAPTEKDDANHQLEKRLWAAADQFRANSGLKAGVLPRNYQIFNGTLLKELLKKVSEIPVSLDYDVFGRIYEYFLGQFARTEGQKGGEFYTPARNIGSDRPGPGNSRQTASGELASFLSWERACARRTAVYSTDVPG